MLDGIAHALAEEPGVEAAPQTAAAKRVDELAVEWFRAEARLTRYSGCGSRGGYG